MIAALASRRIAILDAPHGYQVELVPHLACTCWDQWFEHHHEAKAYARALFASMGWAIDDLSTHSVEHCGADCEEGAASLINQPAGMLTVQQLNHAQWHVVDPDGRWTFSVTDWATAVSTALWASRLTDLGVESVGLNGDRLPMLLPGRNA